MKNQHDVLYHKQVRQKYHDGKGVIHDCSNIDLTPKESNHIVRALCNKELKANLIFTSDEAITCSKCKNEPYPTGENK